MGRPDRESGVKQDDNTAELRPLKAASWLFPCESGRVLDVPSRHPQGRPIPKVSKFHQTLEPWLTIFHSVIVDTWNRRYYVDSA